MLFQAVMLLMKFCLESCLDQKLVYNASGPFQPAKIWGTKEYDTAIRSVHKLLNSLRNRKAIAGNIQS
jgi:hypothetical protein